MEGPSRHVGVYQSTVTNAQEGRHGQSRTRGRTEMVHKAQERGAPAIGILKMTVLRWTVSFILDQVLPRFKLTSLREVTGWQPPTILESRDFNSTQEPRSLETEDLELACPPNPSKTQYHPCEAGRSYGPAGGIYRKYLGADWNPWHPFRSAKDFELR